ncbi:MAG: hypothetical protein L3J79_03555 [Candidatus Marinimicrobia bacterium]|nr:hypothetical protein [Candidatus Neomarinimicrobiota bacterium]
MRIKRSGRVVIVTTLMLALYSGLIIWHNKPPRPDRSQVEQAQQLIRAHPELKVFLERVDSDHEAPAFYSIGIPGKADWPTCLSRACYLDPLAARWQFSATRDAYSDKIELIRYRSRSDFLDLLLRAEQESPGYVSQLDFRSHTTVPENPFTVSLRSLLAVIFGALGLLVVKRVQKDHRSNRFNDAGK